MSVKSFIGLGHSVPLGTMLLKFLQP
jgi:hypothetical protein